MLQRAKIMVSSSYPRAEEIRQGTNNSDLRKISDQQLVRLCLENTRPAWEEFFHRFIPSLRGKLAISIISILTWENRRLNKVRCKNQ